MEGTADNLALLLAGKLVKVYRIARNANGEVRVSVGVFIGIYKRFAV